MTLNDATTSILPLHYKSDHTHSSDRWLVLWHVTDISILSWIFFEDKHQNLKILRCPISADHTQHTHTPQWSSPYQQDNKRRAAGYHHLTPSYKVSQKGSLQVSCSALVQQAGQPVSQGNSIQQLKQQCTVAMNCMITQCSGNRTDTALFGNKNSKLKQHLSGMLSSRKLSQNI